MAEKKESSTATIFRSILDMVIWILKVLHLMKTREKEDRAAEEAGEIIQEKVDNVQNPETPPSDPLGTDDWNDGK